MFLLTLLTFDIDRMIPLFVTLLRYGILESRVKLFDNGIFFPIYFIILCFY